MGARRFVSDDERRARAARRHRLAGEHRTDDVAAIADDVVALHSSDPATVYLSTLARMTNPRLDAVDTALYDDRSLIRHHAMRRTMWVMTPLTARRAHAAATAKIASAERARTLAAFADSPEIDDAEAWLRAAVRDVVDVLAARGPMTAREVGVALPHLVVPVVFGAATRNPAAMNAHTKVLQYAGFDGQVVRTRPSGSWTSSEYAWAPVESWLDGPIAGMETQAAAAELLGHWLRRFGPANEIDIRWWFGWTAAATGRALAAVRAEQVDLDGGGLGWLARDDLQAVPDPSPWVRLLPGLDPTAMGWKERGWYLSDLMVPRLFDRFGNAGPTIWADGRVVGGWVQRPGGQIAFDILAPLTAGQRTLLDSAAEQLAAVLDEVIVKPRFPSPNQRELLA